MAAVESRPRIEDDRLACGDIFNNDLLVNPGDLDRAEWAFPHLALAGGSGDRGCQEILRTAEFVVLAKAGTQEQATEIPGFPLLRERRI